MPEERSLPLGRRVAAWMLVTAVGGCAGGAELDQPERYAPEQTRPELRAHTTSTTGASEFVDCDVNAAMMTCGGSFCHGQPGAESTATLGGGLDLFAATRETDLVNRAATYIGVPADEAASCPSPPELLIDAVNPDSSLILTKLTGMQACGPSMPPGGTLAPEELQCIRDWVRFVADNAVTTGGP